MMNYIMILFAFMAIAVSSAHSFNPLEYVRSVFAHGAPDAPALSPLQRCDSDQECISSLTALESCNFQLACMRLLSPEQRCKNIPFCSLEPCFHYGEVFCKRFWLETGVILPPDMCDAIVFDEHLTILFVFMLVLCMVSSMVPRGFVCRNMYWVTPVAILWYVAYSERVAEIMDVYEVDSFDLAASVLKITVCGFFTVVLMAGIMLSHSVNNTDVVTERAATTLIGSLSSRVRKIDPRMSILRLYGYDDQLEQGATVWKAYPPNRETNLYLLVLSVVNTVFLLVVVAYDTAAQILTALFNSKILNFFGILSILWVLSRIALRYVGTPSAEDSTEKKPVDDEKGSQMPTVLVLNLLALCVVCFYIYTLFKTIGVRGLVSQLGFVVLGFVCMVLQFRVHLKVFMYAGSIPANNAINIAKALYSHGCEIRVFKTVTVVGGVVTYIIAFSLSVLNGLASLFPAMNKRYIPQNKRNKVFIFADIVQLVLTLVIIAYIVYLIPLPDRLKVYLLCLSAMLLLQEVTANVIAIGLIDNSADYISAERFGHFMTYSRSCLHSEGLVPSYVALLFNKCSEIYATPKMIEHVRSMTKGETMDSFELVEQMANVRANIDNVRCNIGKLKNKPANEFTSEEKKELADLSEKLSSLSFAMRNAVTFFVQQLDVDVDRAVKTPIIAPITIEEALCLFVGFTASLPREVITLETGEKFSCYFSFNERKVHHETIRVPLVSMMIDSVKMISSIFKGDRVIITRVVNHAEMANTARIEYRQ